MPETGCIVGLAGHGRGDAECDDGQRRNEDHEEDLHPSPFEASDTLQIYA